MTASVNAVKSKVKHIQSDLNESFQVNRVFENRKLLASKNEEVALAKNELTSYIQTNSQLLADLNDSRSSNAELTKRIQELESENMQLINRILTEKSKNVDQLNEMNSLVDEKIKLRGASEGEN